MESIPLPQLPLVSQVGHTQLYIKMRYNAAKLVSSLIVLLSVTPGPSEAGLRCGTFSFLGKDRACRASCWIQGKTTGNEYKYFKE
jgi:hypothetical protein